MIGNKLRMALTRLYLSGESITSTSSMTTAAMTGKLEADSILSSSSMSIADLGLALWGQPITSTSSLTSSTMTGGISHPAINSTSTLTTANLTRSITALWDFQDQSWQGWVPDSTANWGVVATPSPPSGTSGYCVRTTSSATTFVEHTFSRTVTCANGTAYFDAHYSGNSGHYVKVDGAVVSMPLVSQLGNSWARYSFPVTAGNRTITFVAYSGAAFAQQAFDNITIPIAEATQYNVSTFNNGTSDWFGWTPSTEGGAGGSYQIISNYASLYAPNSGVWAVMVKSITTAGGFITWDAQLGYPTGTCKIIIDGVTTQFYPVQGVWNQFSAYVPSGTHTIRFEVNGTNGLLNLDNISIPIA